MLKFLNQFSRQSRSNDEKRNAYLFSLLESFFCTSNVAVMGVLPRQYARQRRAVAREPGNVKAVWPEGDFPFIEKQRPW
jgi:hypothetical protein